MNSKNYFQLTRIFHAVSTAAAQSGMSTALRLFGILDILFYIPSSPSRRAPGIHARLRRLATNRYEISGLTLFLSLIMVFSTGCGQRRIATGTPDKTSLGSMVANTATTQIGRPYRAGGSTPQRGFDCSGLVFWSYGQHGVQIPRTTTGQAKVGASISRSNLMPGDIVVFREPSGPNQLHTGIYIGNNNFVHSPNSRGSVRIESLNASHWRRVFVSGRRII